MSKALVIGAGPSLKEFNHLDKLAKSNFRDCLVITDKMLVPVLQAGINPLEFQRFVVCTIEDNSEIAYFYKDFLVHKYRDNIEVFHSERTHVFVRDSIKAAGLYKVKEFQDFFIHDVHNVGLMCWYVAHQVLNCSNIAFIGTDLSLNQEEIPLINPHSTIYENIVEEITNPHTNQISLLVPRFSFHRLDFLKWIPKFPEVKTYNCSGKGSLFGEGIIWEDFDKWLRMNA